MSTTTQRERKMVRAGTVRAGDTVGGRIVSGLGRTWTLPSEDNCAWGAEPHERVRVQYAYLKDAPAHKAAPGVDMDDADAIEAEMDRLAEVSCDYSLRAKVRKAADAEYDKLRTRWNEIRNA